MNTVNAAVRLDRPTDLTQPGRNLRRWWTVITALLAATFFLQAIFAGAMLSGVGWAHKAHSVTAALLIASAVAAGVASVVTLRRFRDGPRLGLTLLALAAAAFLQAAIGVLSAKGVNLAWVHVPLGVALVGLAAQAVAGARRLGD
jgi:hypothetical protein